MNATTGGARLLRWWIAGLGAPVALLLASLAVGVIDLGSLPLGDVAGGSVLAAACGWASLAQLLAVQVRVLLGQQLAVALLLSAGHGARSKRVVAVFAIAFDAFTLGWLYMGLVSYGPFAGYPPFWISALAFWVCLAISDLQAIYSQRAGRRVAFIVGGTFAFGALALSYVNYLRFIGDFPTLHIALMCATLICVHRALVAAWSSASDVQRTRGLVAGSSLLVLAVATAITPHVQRCPAGIDPVVQQFSISARPRDLGDIAHVLPEPPCTQPPAQLSEARALQLFSQYAKLPQLPADFALARYNVLLIHVEALRADTTDVAGFHAGTTPALARLVSAGAFDFTRAQAPAPTTRQTVTAMFSIAPPSLSPLTIQRYRTWVGAMLPEGRSLLGAFQRAGFHTFAVPHSRFLPSVASAGGAELDEVVAGKGEGMDDDDLLATRTEQVLGRLADGSQKFFGWVFLSSPHNPYKPHPGRRARDDRSLYAGEVAYTDAQIGRIIAALERNGQLASTIVIATGDHGESFGEHGTFLHNSDLHDESVHVPLVVWIPGVHGARVVEAVSALHVLPWLMLRGPEPLASFARTAITDSLGPALAASGGAVAVERIDTLGSMFSLRYPNDLKLIHFLRSRYTQVYDTRRDPGEQIDLLARHDPRALALLPTRDAYAQLWLCEQRFRFSKPRP